MKKSVSLLLAALLLMAAFAGCSASAYMDDPYNRGYSNVSTTHNGTVNGTNGRYSGYGAYGYGYDTGAGAYYDTAPGTSGAATGTNRTVTGSAAGRTGSYTGTTSGTGMTGGR